MRPEQDLQERALDAIGNPVRRQILRLVARAPMPVSRIAVNFDISRPAISRHLATLEHAGLLRHNMSGTRNLYEIDRQGLRNLRAWLDQLEDLSVSRSAISGTGSDELEDPFAGLLDE